MSLDRLKTAEELIGYRFVHRKYLLRALKSAGADENDYDGNRMLAQLGTPLIGLYAAKKRQSAGAKAGTEDDFTREASSVKRHEAIARSVGLDDCIRSNPRQPNAAPRTLSLAIRAIAAAVWEDSGGNTECMFRAMDNIGLLGDRQICVSPSRLLCTQDSSQRILTPVSCLESDEFNELLEFGDLNSVDDRGTPQATSESIGLATTGYDCSLSRVSMTAEAGVREGGQTLIDTFDRSGSALSEEYSDLVEILPFAREENVIRGSEHTESLKRRKSTGTIRASKRQMVATAGSPTFEEFLNTERSRYHRLSREFREELYFLPDFMENGGEVSKTEHFPIVQNLFAGVASCESFAHLQALVLYVRNTYPATEMDPAMPLSLQLRMHAIDCLGTQSAYCALLRRYHILELYREHKVHPTQNTEFIVTLDNQGFATKKGQRGNPRNNSAAEVSLAMFRNIYPSAPKDVHEKMLRQFKKLRRLGQRFHTLTERFGYGFLALLPVASEISVISVTDDMLLRPNEQVFKHLVNSIERSQGSTLRLFTAVVDNIVKAAFSGALKQLEPLNIEKTTRENILKFPKLSPELLVLISEGL